MNSKVSKTGSISPSFKRRRISQEIEESNVNNSPLYQLPNEILEKILNYVDVESMRSGGLLTCRKFNEIMTVSREFSKKLRLLVYYADNEMPLRKSPLNDLDYCMALLESNLKFESVTVSNITSHNEMIHVLLMLQKFSDTIKELEVKDCTSLGIMEFTKLFRLLPNLEVVTLNEIDLEFFDDGDDISYTRPALPKLRELKITESSDEVLEIFLVCQVEKFQTDLICRDFLSNQLALKKLIVETSDFDLFDEDVTEQFKFQLHFLEYTGIPANAENFAKFIKTQVNLVDLDFRLDICSEELLLVLNAMPPTVKRLGFEAKQYEGEVAEGILHYTNNHVESLNIMYIWILCGTNKWTLDMMEKFVGRFTALKFLNLHLNKCSENLMDLTFAEMKNLETVEVELWNDEVMLPHLNIPKLKYLRTVNTERSLSSWKIAMEKNPSIEKIRIDDRAKINLVKLILSECQSLQTLIISGYISPQTKAILKEEFPERYHMIKF